MAAISNAATAGAISGSVYLDQNANGARDAGEAGILGIQVNAVDELGNTSGPVLSAADGTYSLPSLPGSSARVEFSKPAAGAPAAVEPLRPGAAGPSSVQFVDISGGAATGVDVGYNDPSLFCQADVGIIAPCFVTNNLPGDPAIISMPLDEITQPAQPFVHPSATGSNQWKVIDPAPKTTLANQSQVGLTNGVTYRRSSRTLFAAAFARFTNIGAASVPNGLGAIYSIDPDGVGAPSLLTTVSNVNNGAFTGAGTNVGIMGLGDIEISDDGNALYAVNIHDHSLVTIPLSGNPPVAGTHSTTALPTPTDCSSGNIHAFALSKNRGRLYIGMTCGAPIGDLRGYVYETDTAVFTQTLSFPFNYARANADANAYGRSGNKFINNNHNWIDWNTYPNPNPCSTFNIARSQPWLVDIDFDNGDMVLGIRSRLADASPGSCWVMGGEMLRACADDPVVPTVWTLESGGICNGRTTTLPPPAIDPFIPGRDNVLVSNLGPGGGEFYWGDDGFEGEAFQGGMVQIPGLNYIIGTQIDVIGHRGQVGLMRMSHDTGAIVGAANVFIGKPTGNGIWKSNGLGNLNATCDNAPIEVGNRVWDDQNVNGVQDPGEPGIPGVEVKIECAGTDATFGSSDDLLATEITAADGSYVFDEVATSGGAPGAIPTQMMCRVLLDTSQPNLADRIATTEGVGGVAGDIRDSDAGTGSTIPAGNVGIKFTTGGAGENDHTYDFGFYELCLGNQVWMDNDSDGVYEPGDGEMAISSVKLNLYADSDGDGVLTPGFDVLLDMTTTGFGPMAGRYEFCGLQSGEFVVEVDPSNFDPGGSLEGKVSTRGNDVSGIAPDPDDDGDSDDNGDPVPGAGDASKAVSLLPATEPTDDADTNPNSNTTIDFGYVQMCLGDLVWMDTDADGSYEPDGADATPGTGDDEPVVSGVKMNLYVDTDGNGVLTPGTDVLVDMTTTNGAGLYEFCGMQEGDYVVEVDPSNLEPGGVMAGKRNSEGNDVSGTPPDPDDDADDDDNGAPVIGAGVASEAVTMIASNEPTNDADTDSSTNTTLDFGFFELCLGDLVWMDTDGDGTFDAGEMPIGGVKVNLYEDTDGSGDFTPLFDTPVDMDTTGPTGRYEFCGLTPGEYVVEIDETSFDSGEPLDGKVSTRGNDVSGAAPDPDDDLDGDDAGDPVPGEGVASKSISLLPGTEPTDDADVNPTTNTTVDFGFVEICIGDLIFMDIDGDGTFETGDGDMGVDDVKVVLWLDSDGSGALDPDLDTMLDMTMTSGGGEYEFCALEEGEYIIQVDPSAHEEGGPLETKLSSAGAPDPDDDVDGDDNGDPAPDPEDGDVTKPVTLRASEEPDTDGDTDPSTNKSVDLGFVELCLGNQVWMDTDSDGVFEPGDGEMGIGGVKLNLYDDSDDSGDFTPLFDQLIDMTFSAFPAGSYEFCGIPPGDYIVVVDPTNFDPASPLDGKVGTRGNDVAGVAPDPDDDTDDDDNGDPKPGLDPIDGVASLAVTIEAGTEPTDDADTNPSSNTTIDFGFVELCLGNLVWKDFDGDGTFVPDGADSTPGSVDDEFGIDGVKVVLWEDTNESGVLEEALDAMIGMTDTAGGGLYEFCGLEEKDYLVEVDETNFDPGEPLEILRNTSGNGATPPDPDDDVDDDDNGEDQANESVLAPPVTLRASLEPDDDEDTDLSTNTTVDFGFVEMCIGDLVWNDRDNDGVYEPADGEEPMGAVKVNLYFDTDGNGEFTPFVDELVDMVTTKADGIYEFCGLLPEEYIVQIPPEMFEEDAPLEDFVSSIGNDDVMGMPPDPDDDIDGDDNGDFMDDRGITTKAVTMLPGTEPGPPDGNTNTNETVDLGVVELVCVGNQVWDDEDANGRYEPNDIEPSLGEEGIGGVTINLYMDADGDGAFDPDVDMFLHFTETDERGRYHFCELFPKDYLVEIAPENFDVGASLEGYTSPIANGEPAPDPDDDVDNDDNGDQQAFTPVPGEGPVGKAVSLAADTEPEFDRDDDDDDEDDTDINNTVDFGVIKLCVGSQIWREEDNDGVYEPEDGEEGGPDVKLNLYEDTDGDGHYTPGVDLPLAMGETDEDGGFHFCRLLPGDYIVQVDESNFGPGMPLGFDTSTTGNDDEFGNPPDPDDDINNDDNGMRMFEEGIVSMAVTIAPRSEPVDDEDIDPNSNMTLDFGCTNVADLQIEKFDDLAGFMECDPAAAGAMITYDLVITNNGPADAAEVHVIDNLPAGAVLDPDVVDVTITEGAVIEVRDDGRIELIAGMDPDLGGVPQLGRMNPNSVVTVTIQVMVPLTAECGSVLTNNALVEAQQNDAAFMVDETPTRDPDLTNNEDSEDTQIECTLLALEKTLSLDGECPGIDRSGMPPVGPDALFCLEITNAGTTWLDDIHITDTLKTLMGETLVYTDTVIFGADPKLPLAPGESVIRSYSLPGLGVMCGNMTNTVEGTAIAVNSGRTPMPCMPLAEATDVLELMAPCGGADMRLGLPIINGPGDADCDTWLQIQNVGANPTKALIVFWGEHGNCPPQSAGPLKLECTGLLRPGSAWSMSADMLPIGAKSAIAYSMHSETRIPSPRGNPLPFADVACGFLFQSIVGDHLAWAEFDEAYRTGGTFRVPISEIHDPLMLDFGMYPGEKIAISVNQACPDPTDEARLIHAAYTGLSKEKLGAYDPRYGGYTYYTPMVFAETAGLNTLLSVQNLGIECTSLEIYYKAQENCLRPTIGDVLSLSPGETITIDPSAVVGVDWVGSAWVRASQPLAIGVATSGPSHLTIYSGVPGDIHDLGFSIGSQINFAPLIYSEYQGWDSALTVQNLSAIYSAKVKVYFLDKSGDIITTLVDWICPRGSQTYFLPVIEALPGNWAGSARAESQEWITPGGPLVDPPRIQTVVLLEKFSDAARTERREAVAYNALTEQTAYDWQIGKNDGGQASGSAVIAIPLIAKGNRGMTSEIAITNLVPVPGFTDFAILMYDQNGLLDYVCQKLGAKQVEYIDLNTWGIVPPNFMGSAVISATFWEHDVFDGRGGFLRNVVGLGAVAVERIGGTLGGEDVPGDESKAFEAVPIFDFFRDEGGIGCPGVPRGVGPRD